MILSHKWRLIFIKGQKVAGTSFEMALSQICGEQDIITPISQVDILERLKKGGYCKNFHQNPEIERQYLDTLQKSTSDTAGNVRRPQGIFTNHMSRLKLEEVYQRLYSKKLPAYDLVAITRNPYAKIMSYVNFMIGFNTFKKTGKIPDNRKLISRGFDAILANDDILTVRNKPRYEDSKGCVKDVNLLRYENLQEDIQNFLERKGIKDFPSLPFAKKGLASNRLDPQHIFTDSQIERVNELFDDEFKAFGYKKIASR